MYVYVPDSGCMWVSVCGVYGQCLFWSVYVCEWVCPCVTLCVSVGVSVSAWT